MRNPDPVSSQSQAAKAFSTQAPVFDEIYGADPMIVYKRQRVRDHVIAYLSKNASILELNAGTGEDAIFFAQKGHTVHATDISEGMQRELNAKVHAAGLDNKITTELISYTDLEHLKKTGPYDLIFSNFAGLNCTGHLERVLKSFGSLQQSGAQITLVILPGFCLWELLLVFKGQFKTAFRRFFSSKGRRAKVEGVPFTCWYYSPQYVKSCMGEEYELIALEGLCTIVPPSYLENFSSNYPKLTKVLMRLEEKWKSSWPLRSVGDYYIISFRKK